MSLISNMYSVGINEANGVMADGLEFKKDELLDITLTADKTFTPAADTYLEVGLFCEIIDNLG